MTTIKNLIQDYSDRINNASDKSDEAEKILTEILNLPYSGGLNDGNPEDAVLMRDLLNRLLLPLLDNKAYLDLVKHIMEQIRRAKKK